MGQIKVAIIIPSLSHGGAERVASSLANHWVKNEDLDVYVYNFSVLPKFYQLSTDVKYINFPISQKAGLFELIKLSLSIRRSIRKSGIHAVLSFMDKYNVFVRLITLGTGVRVTLSDRSNPFRPLGRGLKWLKRMTYPFADGVIAQTELAAGEIKRSTGARQIVVIPNPVRIPDGAMTEARERVLLSVGRLVAEKGHADLIRAFAIAGMSDWELFILGEGPLKHELQALADSLGVGRQVHFPGAMKDVHRWYGRASIFGFCSHSEGFPNALSEAMASGLPCVSYNCNAGPSELIEHQASGYLVPVGDIKGAAHWLKLLSLDPPLRTKVGGRARDAVRRLNPHAIAHKYLVACLGPELIVRLDR